MVAVFLFSKELLWFWGKDGNSFFGFICNEHILTYSFVYQFGTRKWEKWPGDLRGEWQDWYQGEVGKETIIPMVLGKWCHHSRERRWRQAGGQEESGVNELYSTRQVYKAFWVLCEHLNLAIVLKGWMYSARQAYGMCSGILLPFSILITRTVCMHFRGMKRSAQRGPWSGW